MNVAGWGHSVSSRQHFNYTLVSCNLTSCPSSASSGVFTGVGVRNSEFSAVPSILKTREPTADCVYDPSLADVWPTISRRRRDSTVKLSLVKVARCILNSQLAHDDCRRRMW